MVDIISDRIMWWCTDIMRLRTRYVALLSWRLPWNKVIGQFFSLYKRYFLIQRSQMHIVAFCSLSRFHQFVINNFKWLETQKRKYFIRGRHCFSWDVQRCPYLAKLFHVFFWSNIPFQKFILNIFSELVNVSKACDQPTTVDWFTSILKSDCWSVICKLRF